MIVWLCVVAYCALCIFAPSVIGALIDRLTGVKDRYSKRHIRISGMVFAIFITIVTVLDCTGRLT
jgi:hypothetical protein